MARFDWYQGTTHEADVDEVAGAFLHHFDLSDLRPTTPRNGYTHGVAIARGDHTLATIWFGGNRGVHVKGTGNDSPAVAHVLRSFEHRVSRVDACTDWDEEGLFDRMAAGLIRYAEPSRIRISQQGDWIRGEGRTLYLGSRASAGQLVLYEKGYQMGMGCSTNWVRLEARAYPKGEAGYRVAAWAPGQVYGATAWMTDALAHIGWDHLEAQRIGTVWRPTDEDRARAALLRQYGPILRSWAEEVGGFRELGEELSRQLQPQDTEEATTH